jgi:alpha-tubulin suppressor-like RCC1 family protein
MEEYTDNLLEEEQEEEPSVEKKVTALIYSWGRNEDGELAIANNKVAHTPTPIRGFRGVAREVASARTHTAIINAEGQIYMAGSLLFGKIGIVAQVNNFR